MSVIAIVAAVVGVYGAGYYTGPLVMKAVKGLLSLVTRA